MVPSKFVDFESVSNLQLKMLFLQQKNVHMD